MTDLTDADLEVLDSALAECDGGFADEAIRTVFLRAKEHGLAEGNKERDALRADAERLQAMAAEWNQNRRGVRYAGMPIWDALCEAMGDDADGEKMRVAIDAARKEKS